MYEYYADESQLQRVKGFVTDAAIALQTCFRDGSIFSLSQLLSSLSDDFLGLPQFL
jgi:hypothetical protein